MSPKLRMALVAMAALVCAPGAHAARGVIYGVNDANFQRVATWPQMSNAMAPLAGAGNTQLGLWVRYHCPREGNPELTAGIPDDLGPVPRTQPVLVQLLGAAACSPTTRRARHRFAGYARGLVRRYPQIRELQVWNEPDLAFWQGSMIDYARLLAATHDALRGTGVKVLGPGFSPHVTQGEGVLEDFAAAVRILYLQAHRHGSILDGFAYHPYWGYSNGATAEIVRTLNTYWRGTGQRTPRRGLRLWWTETGAESYVNEAPGGEFGNGYYGTTNGWPGELGMMGDADFQAYKVGQVARAARASKWVAADFNFQLSDDQNLGRWQSGLLWATGQPKPAYVAFEAAVAART